MPSSGLMCALQELQEGKRKRGREDVYRYNGKKVPKFYESHEYKHSTSSTNSK
jgi:hypothetical protein